MSNTYDPTPAGGMEPDPANIPADPPIGPKRKSLAKKLLLLGLILLVVAGASLGGAEYYTSRPDFCGTCHIMGPYYESWSEDLHGKRADVWCVDCHYAPGHQHTVMAKFRGLSQLASYFSGRFGASRPRAHVSDTSCLTSKCHGGWEHLNKQILIGEPRTETRYIDGQPLEVHRKPTVRFVHAKHRDVESRIAETTASLEEAAARVRDALTPDQREQVARAAKSIEPSIRRESAMRELIKSFGRPELVPDALEWMRLEHYRIRLEQLGGLNCAACHTYDATGVHHFRVDQSACFTCHFTNQAFNRDTGECLKCHEPPVRKIIVHGLGSSTTQGASALMDHQDIVERKIDCASCHLDVIQGAATVGARDCTHCHDQGRYLKDFDARTTETVEEYHRIHVARQHARCVDCHRSIRHQLIEPEQIGSSADFLRPVLDDCQHCHPGHHREQVQLLMGVGGQGVDRAMPNAMFGSRLNCRACHSQPGSDFKGDPLIKATEDTCLACHGTDYKVIFQQWLSEIETHLKEAEHSLARAEQQLERLTQSGGTIPPHVGDMVRAARENIRFIKGGNGVHNRNYALQLLDLAQRNLDESLAELSRLETR